MPVPAAGSVNLAIGDKAAVLWKAGRPYLILAHNARRAQFGPHISESLPILEQLLIVGSAGSREVYFRNDKQTVSLDIRSQLPEDPYDVRWGGDSDNAFVVLCAPSFTFHVFELSRNHGKGAGSASVSATYRPQDSVVVEDTDITLLKLNLVSSSSGSQGIQEIHGLAFSGYGLGDLHDFASFHSFSGSLTVKLDLDQLVAGFSNDLVNGTDFQYQLSQLIRDFRLEGTGTVDDPYNIILSVIVNYNVSGNGTYTGTTSFLSYTCSPTEPLSFNYGSSEAGWNGQIGPLRAGYVVNLTTETVIHSGTGSEERTFSKTEHGGRGVSPLLTSTEEPINCTNLQETNYIEGLDAVPSGDTGLTFSGPGASAIQDSAALNLLDPVSSPFINEDDLSESIESLGSEATRYFCRSGQAKPNVPMFAMEGGTAAGGTWTTYTNTFEMVDLRILHRSTDKDKTRLWAVLRHEEGQFSVLSRHVALKVVLLDGWFNVLYVLTDWSRWIYRDDTPTEFVNSDHVEGTIGVLSSNANHVLWRENIGSASTGTRGPISEPQYTQRRRTLLANVKTGVVLVVAEDEPGSTANQDIFDALDLNVVGVAVDFFHEGKEDDRRCLEAWKLDDANAADYKDPTFSLSNIEADEVLDAATVLDDLPNDLPVVVPTETRTVGAGQFEDGSCDERTRGKFTHGINDHDVLGPLGRDEDEEL